MVDDLGRDGGRRHHRLARRALALAADAERGVRRARARLGVRPLPTPPERLEEAVRGLAALGFAGANVTTPHKLAVAALCVTERRSVNTLRRTGRRGRGIEHRCGDPRRPRGGGARHPRRRRLRDGVRRRAPAGTAVLARGSVAASTSRTRTSSSTRPRSATRCSSSCAPGQTLVDLPYPETATATAARRAGARVVPGLEVLVAQGAASFELWTGQPAPLGAMRGAVGLLP